MYVETIVNNNRQLQPVIGKTQLKVGDKVVVRLTVRLDRTMDFVQLKDQRAVCLEPVEVLSGYRNVGDVGCYVAVKDASTDFFFDTLNKGTYVLEYSYRVDRVEVMKQELLLFKVPMHPNMLPIQLLPVTKFLSK